MARCGHEARSRSGTAGAATSRPTSVEPAARRLTTVVRVLELTRAIVDEIVAHAVASYPYEACGLLAGAADGGVATHFHPCRNAAGSARVYTLDPLDHLRAERVAEERGEEIIGVVHSHTHSPAVPSPTDVKQAPDRTWHYAIVSLQDEHAPDLRSYRIDGDAVTEEPIALRA